MAGRAGVARGPIVSCLMPNGPLGHTLDDAKASGADCGTLWRQGTRQAGRVAGPKYLNTAGKYRLGPGAVGFPNSPLRPLPCMVGSWGEWNHLVASVMQPHHSSGSTPHTCCIEQRYKHCSALARLPRSGTISGFCRGKHCNERAARFKRKTLWSR